MQLSQDQPITRKIEAAEALYAEVGQGLLQDPRITTLLKRYEEAIKNTWQIMEEVGVVKICTRCAIDDGGSCCGVGIERKFDVVLLLINLLMGSKLPRSPWDDTGCWFLGPRGCTIMARHTICVNYLCKRLQAAIPMEKIQRLQEAIFYETDVGFTLEEEIKRRLRQ